MRIAATLALIVITFPAFGCDPATGLVDYDDFVTAEGVGEFGEWVKAGQYSRTYYLHTPPGMSQEEDYPLLIMLHGAGGTGESFHGILRADETTDAAGFVTVYPDGMEGTWTIGCGYCTSAERLKAEDVSFLETLTRHLAEYLPIDTTRVYLIGYSQGGSLSHLFGCQSSIIPAGIGSVASLIPRDLEQTCSPAGAFPVAFVHGTGDQSAPYYGWGDSSPALSVPEMMNMWVEKMACGDVPMVTETPDTASDGTTITSFRFDGCAAGSSVLHYRVNEGAHNWPGDTGPWPILTGRHSRNLDTTREILDFFQDVDGEVGAGGAR